jgi:hypothetical protein
LTKPPEAAAHGFYRGDNTACDNTTGATRPMGACCVQTSTGTRCVRATQADCDRVHGTYQGDGTMCTDATCPQPTGACCVRNPAGGPATCSVMTHAACVAALGAYHGDGSTCDNVNCNTCPCDFNHDGQVNDTDLQLFLVAYGQGDADINGDGVTDQEDIVAFLMCYNSPGPGCNP